MTAFGTLVGLELLAFGLALGFRHHLDGVCYPWPIPLAFFAAGAGVTLAATEVHLNGYVTAPALTLVGWTLLAVVGLVAFYHYWNEYPQLRGDRSEVRPGA